jgi:hypothetical protein
MATLSGFQNGAAIKLAEVSGLSGDLDASYTLDGTTANPTIGPITTKNANDMLIGLERGATPSAMEWVGPIPTPRPTTSSTEW